MRLSHLLSVLTSSALVFGCSQKATISDAGPMVDAGPIVDGGSTDDGGPILDGGDAGVSCGSDLATASMPCGTLAWAKSAVDSRARNHHVTWLATVDAGVFLYAAGGYNGAGGVQSNVDLVPVLPDGTLGTWTATTSLPLGVAGATGGPVSKFMVIAGGVAAGQSLASDQSEVAPINGDGTLGPWTSAGSILHPREHAGSFVVGNTIYVLGGYDVQQTVWDDIVQLQLASDGTPTGAWTTIGTLPSALSHFAVTLVNGTVYITGGLTQPAQNGALGHITVYGAPLASDGTFGNWASLAPLPVALATHASFFYGGYLYVCGGINTTPAQVSGCWNAPIQTDHSLGSWQVVASLLIARAHVHQLPIWLNHVYSVSGAIDFNLNSTPEIDIGTFE